MKHPVSQTFAPRPFRPATWALSPHAQTLFARTLRSGDGPAFERERLTTPDRDFIDLDWAPDPRPDAPIALVLHGLEGSARRRYVRNVCRELLARGIRPVALNMRGCSGEPNRALIYYHSGKTDDPAFVLTILRGRYPNRRIGAVGFSLGGNVLLKMMGERVDGGCGLLDAAVAMSVPYDLAAGSKVLERSIMGRAYAGYFLRSLQRKVRWKEERLGAVLDVASGLAARTIWEFDERVTAPLHGFASAEDYYGKASSAQFLGGIRVPTLLLHANDDPFIPVASVPVERVARSPDLHLVRHERGGHVGFLEGWPWSPSFWGDEESARFLAERLVDAKSTPS
jgi:uncharacterized protein